MHQRLLVQDQRKAARVLRAVRGNRAPEESARCGGDRAEAPRRGDRRRRHGAERAGQRPVPGGGQVDK